MTTTSSSNVSAPSRDQRAYRFDDAVVSSVEPIRRNRSQVPSGVRRTEKHRDARRERAFSRQFCRSNAFDLLGDE